VRYVKYGAFILLAIVSAYLSVNMFVSLGADNLGKAVLGVVAIALESTKVFSLLRIEYTMHMRKSNTLIRLPWASMLIYTTLALLSVVASLGFTLVTVDKQVESSKTAFVSVAEDYTFEIEQKKVSLAQVDAQILTMQSQMGDINADYASGLVKMSDAATKLSENRDALIAEISALNGKQRAAVAAVSQSSENNVYGMFVLMGNFLGGMSEKQVMTFLLLLVSILIEVSMLYTSPTITIRPEEAHEVLKAKAAPAPAEEAVAEASRTRNRRAAIKNAGRVQLEASTPHIITEQKRASIEERSKALLQKLLVPAKGTELKPAAVLAYETGTPSEKISELFGTLAKIRGPGGPYLIQKNTAWHLAYMKDLTISAAMKSSAIMKLLEEMVNVSEAR